MSLNNKYLTLPGGVYISGDFSITAWISVALWTTDTRIFEAGNPTTYDNVAFGFANNTNRNPFVVLFNGNESIRVVSPVTMAQTKWTHLAATLNGTTLRIYMNNNLTIESDVTGFVPRNVFRTNCYIGFSSLPNVLAPKASFDQIKIFNRALSSDEVFADFIGSAL